MAKKIIDEKNINNADDFGTEELPKILSVPKNIGDVLTWAGEIFAWLILLVFVAGLAFYFKDGYSSIASNKYLYFMIASKYAAIVGGVLLLARLFLWGFTTKEILAYRKLLWIDVFVAVLGIISLKYAAIVGGVLLLARFFLWEFTTKEILAYRKLLWMDVFVAAFGIISFFSYMVSSYKHADWGSNNIADWFVQGPFYGLSGWYMGALTYAILVVLYFTVSRCLIYNKTVYIIPVVTVVLISIWGSLNKYNFAPINMHYDYAKKGAVFFSSIGNINWLCGFTSVLVPLIWGLYMGAAKVWEKIVLIVCMIATFEMIILNSSDSGYFALCVTMMVLFGYAITDREKFRRFTEIAMCFFAVSAFVRVQDTILRSRTSEAGHWEPVIGIPSLVAFVLFAALFAITFFIKNWNVKIARILRSVYISLVTVGVVGLIILVTINTMNDGSIISNPAFIINDEWGSNRGITWRLGIGTFFHMDFWHKLVGSGPDTFYYEMVQYDDLKYRVNDFFGGARLTNAHNEIITLLVNVGILGTAAFVGMIAVSVKESFTYAKKRPEMLGFGLAIISYFANNMFSFQQITNIPFLFIVLGMEGAAIAVYDKAAVRLTKKDIKNKMHKSKKSRKKAKK